MLLAEVFLTELDWLDKSPLVAILRRHPGKWLHMSRGAPARGKASDGSFLHGRGMPDPLNFRYGRDDPAYKRAYVRWERSMAANRVPKLGINPNPTHKDPNGIYFYPVGWILQGHDRVRSGSQYGLDMPFYYVCDIDMTAAGVTMSRLTFERVQEIADRNGWGDDLKAFWNLPETERAKFLPYYADERRAGSVLWHVVNALVSRNKITWSKAFAGIPYIHDDGTSTIHNHEPHQILVLDPRIVKVIESGEVRPIGTASDHASREAHWTTAYKEIFKRFRGEFGGEITWMKKSPTLTFKAGIATFTISVETGRMMPSPIIMRYTYGRAEGVTSVSDDRINSMTMDQIIEHFRKRVEIVSKRKSDLTFRTYMSESEVKAVIQDRILRVAPDRFETKIHPDSGAYNSITVHAYSNVGDMRAKTTVSSYGDHISFSSVALDYDYGERYGFSLGHTSGNALGLNRISENIDKALRAFAQDLLQHQDQYLKRYGPDGSARTKFSTDRDMMAFKGYLASEGPLSFDGNIERLRADEIAVWNAMTKNEKDNLRSDARYIMMMQRY